MLNFDTLSTRYSIPIPDDRFLALLDSESYATDSAAFHKGNETLCERLLRETPASEVDYNGHFGGHVMLELSSEDDTDEVKDKIAKIIDEHLDWCKTLEIVEHVKARREKVA